MFRNFFGGYSRSTETVLTYYDVCLKQADVDTLRDSRGWLSDQIIAFYFLYLQHQKYRTVAHRLLLVSPQITQLIKLGTLEEGFNFLKSLKAEDKQFFLFAVNDNETACLGGNHWSLLAFSRPSLTFYNFDSMNNFNQNATNQLFEKLKTIFGTQDAHLIQHSNHQQLNNYDCGIHVLCNTENVIRQILCDGNLTRVGQIFECHVASMRQEILELIEYLIGCQNRQNCTVSWK